MYHLQARALAHRHHKRAPHPDVFDNATSYILGLRAVENVETGGGGETGGKRVGRSQFENA
jgi:hypothetical protein